LLLAAGMLGCRTAACDGCRKGECSPSPEAAGGGAYTIVAGGTSD